MMENFQNYKYNFLIMISMISMFFIFKQYTYIQDNSQNNMNNTTIATVTATIDYKCYNAGVTEGSCLLFMVYYAFT